MNKRLEHAELDNDLKAIEGMKERSGKLLGKAMARSFERGDKSADEIAFGFYKQALEAAEQELGSSHPVAEHLASIRQNMSPVAIAIANLNDKKSKQIAAVIVP